MLERDRRRQRALKAVRRIRAKERRAEEAKWAACPNHGHFAGPSDFPWYGFNYWPKPPAHLICLKCQSVWQTHTDVQHP